MVFVFQFVQLWDIFNVTVLPWLSDSNPSSELFGQLFNFVRILNWAILLSFCVFPLINVVHQGLLISGKDDVGVLRDGLCGGVACGEGCAGVYCVCGFD